MSSYIFCFILATALMYGIWGYPQGAALSGVAAVVMFTVLEYLSEREERR